MKKFVLVAVFIIAGCTSTTAIKFPGDPGPLPPQDYIPKIGFEPMQKSINQHLPMINKLIQESGNAVFFTNYQNPTEFTIQNRNVNQSLKDFFERCYLREAWNESGSNIREGIEAIFIKNYRCEGMAFSNLGLYAIGCETYYWSPNFFKAYSISHPDSFISYDDLYDPKTSFGHNYGDDLGSETVSPNVTIRIGDTEFCSEAVLSGSVGIMVSILENARQYAQTGDYQIYNDEIKNFTMKKMPDPLLELFQSNQDNWFYDLYFTDSIPQKVESEFRNCFTLDDSEEILFLVDYSDERLFVNKICSGVVATQLGIHIFNETVSLTSPDYGYRYVPYSYYRENPDYDVSELSIKDLEFIFRTVTTERLQLNPTSPLLLKGYQDEKETIAFLMISLVNAVQGKNIPSYEELQQIVADYKKSIEKPKKVAKANSQQTTRQQNPNSSGKSFFDRIGNVLMPIIEIATILAIADSLGDDTCDMPRMPRANQNYGSQMLNRQPLSPPKDFNKQMNVYNKRAANAKKHCDDKKKDLGLLLSLLD